MLWPVHLYLACTAGVELANKDGMLGKSDPYLKFFALCKVTNTTRTKALKPRLTQTKAQTQTRTRSGWKEGEGERGREK